jgi:hypothetical protein
MVHHVSFRERVASGTQVQAYRRDMTDSPTLSPQTCTLPRDERPVRQAEFDTLFAAALRAVDRVDARHLRLILDPRFENIARDLTGRETECCSFFSFGFERFADELKLNIYVPASQAGVLDALARRADAPLESHQ